MSKMVKLNQPYSFSAILIVCILLGGMLLMPINQALDLPVLEIFDADADQTEFEDDWLILSPFLTTLASLVHSESASMDLDFRSACLSPVLPPPRPS